MKKIAKMGFGRIGARENARETPRGRSHTAIVEG
jgi:hypothetical protein